MIKKYKLILAVLLAFIFLQSFNGARIFSVAMDEQIHLPAGFVHLQSKKIEFRESNAPFIGMLSALPSFLFARPKIDLSDPQILSNNFWDFGNKFLFSNNADRLMLSARMVIIILSILLGFYVFKWSRDLFGTKAGIFSLFLLAFVPVVAAHSSFVSTDIGFAAFFFISSYYFGRFLKESKKKHGIYAGVFLGLTLGSKFSGVFLVPLFALLALVFLFEKRGLDFNKKFLKFISIVLPVFIVGFLILWAIYFFPTDINFYSRGVKLIYAEDANPDYPVYLNGEFKKGGWWYYFIEGFVLKTPMPFLIFLLWSLALLKRYTIKISDKLFLLLPPLAFISITSLQAHNLGARYLIPIYPFLAVYAGNIVNNLKSKTVIILLASLSFWYLFSFVSTYPDQLAYFNEFVGGSNNGYKYMDDSNIDWGHDLKRLKKFVDKNPDTKIAYVWRQGDRALDYYGIGKEKNIIDLKENWWTNPKGTYAVSSHFIVRAKIISRAMKDKSLDWMSLYEPVARIGQSFLIYEF